MQRRPRPVTAALAATLPLLPLPLHPTAPAPGKGAFASADRPAYLLGSGPAFLPKAATDLATDIDRNGPAPRGYNFKPDAAPVAPKPTTQATSIPLRGCPTRLPLIGLGTYSITDPGLVRRALELGYRHFDCALFYGNEKVIGEGIREFVAAGRRSELFLTGKVWNDCHQPADVAASCKQTLADLGVSYLDLYLVHWPIAWKKGTQGEQMGLWGDSPSRLCSGGAALPGEWVHATAARVARLVSLPENGAI